MARPTAPTPGSPQHITGSFPQKPPPPKRRDAQHVTRLTAGQHFKSIAGFIASDAPILLVVSAAVAAVVAAVALAAYVTTRGISFAAAVAPYPFVSLPLLAIVAVAVAARFSKTSAKKTAPTVYDVEDSPGGVPKESDRPLPLTPFTMTHGGVQGLCTPLTWADANVCSHVCAGATVSVYKYQHSFPEAFLRRRAQLAAVRNPWLCGEIVSLVPMGDVTHGVFVPDGIPSPDRIAKFLQFEEVEEATLSAPASEADTCRCGDTLMRDPTSPAALVKVQHCPEAKTFRLFASVCHSVGDGATMYRVLSCFDAATPEADIPALTAARLPDWAKTPTVLGADTAKKMWWMLLASAWSPMARLVSPTLRRESSANAADGAAGVGPYVAAIRRVDPSWAAKAKAAHTATPDLPFVSTNDCVCSWFFAALDAALGCVVLDCRRFSPGLHDLCAGNYTQLAALFRGEFTPGHVRTAVTTNGDTTLPAQRRGIVSRISEAISPDRTAAMVTNWASLAKCARLPDIGLGEPEDAMCELIGHVPAIPLEAASVPTGLTQMIVFSPTAGTTSDVAAVVLSTAYGSDKLRRAMAACDKPLVGEVPYGNVTVGNFRTVL